MTPPSPYKVLSFHPAPYGEAQLGFVSVLVKDSVRVVFKVCKTKTANLFVCPTSVKVDGSWVNTFGFVNKDLDKTMMTSILEQVKPMIQAAVARPMQQNQPAQQPYHSDGLPF